VRIEFLLGMGKIGKKFCLILDIDKVLCADEILAVTDAWHAAPVTLRSPAKSRSAESGA